jgi:LPXTG-motif cell wall-anchored protein
VVVRILGAAALTTGALALALATAAGADAGWSRSTGSGLAGGTVRVASSASTRCRWTVPGDDATTTSSSTSTSTTSAPAGAPPADDPVVDGTQVTVRLGRPEVAVLLGTLDVGAGGSWSGTVTLPDAVTLPPGEYQMVVRCVVDRPAVGAVHAYDFGAQPFTVTEAPPPTTVTTVTTVPVEIGDPLVVTNPVEVQGARLDRDPAASSAPATAPAPRLPDTGGSTLELTLAALGSLLVGGGALWWGARSHRPTARVD